MASVDSFFVTRTMQTLEVLAFHSASAPQIADILRVDARTARRLLNRLTDEGWLTRTEGRVRTYTLSLRIVALAAHSVERSALARVAVPVIDDLHDRTGAAAHLSVPSYRSVLCLVHDAGGAEPRPQLRELVPAHACAAGKVLLAHREAWRESVLELPVERLTDRTIVDPDASRRKCEAARRQGFATEDGEYRRGLQGVAAPVRDDSSEVIAAVAVTGSQDANVAGHVDVVTAAAADVEAELASARDDRAA